MGQLHWPRTTGHVERTSRRRVGTHDRDRGDDGTPKRCFVISPIGAEGSAIRQHADEVFDFIVEPALAACGIEALRSDHILEPGKVTDQMFRELMTDMCVAIVTGTTRTSTTSSPSLKRLHGR